MTVDNGVRIIAGTMVLVSLALAYWVNEKWILLAGFVGLNLIQSAFTGLCPAVILLKKLGCKESGSCGCGTKDGQGKCA